MWISGRPVALVVFAASMFGVAACGAAAPETPTAAVTVDPCVVGTWTATSVTGSTDVNGTPLSITGGGDGQVVTFNSDGSAVIDNGKMSPITLQGNGRDFTEKFSGVAHGTITVSGGKISYRPASGSNAESALYAADGSQFGTPAAIAGFTSSYHCLPKQSLELTESTGATFSYFYGNIVK